MYETVSNDQEAFEGFLQLKINQFSRVKKNECGLSAVHLNLKEDNMFLLFNEENRFE